MRIGYGRVFHPRPEPERATRRPHRGRCEQIFVDKASGKLARRPELDKALLAAHRRAAADGSVRELLALVRIAHPRGSHLQETTSGQRIIRGPGSPQYVWPWHGQDPDFVQAMCPATNVPSRSGTSTVRHDSSFGG